MAGRFLLPGIAVLLGAVLLAASAAEARNGAAQTEQRFRLTCQGTMSTEGTPESRILADGVVDFVAMRVRGFGIGIAPIQRLTETVVAFGSPIAGADPEGNAVEGSYDRATGATRIVVRSASGPPRDLIAMDLTCRTVPTGF
ncbi:MAG: hypothetical protein F9K43_04470 [Bauldia sp.]|nr:MAG: hypothetical protein F9K43_04470 [Bauldia sp.]MBZ0228903.1 hypothetical protein [Bauldia sp.]